MKTYIRRILAGLASSDVLTHALPYQARADGRRPARQS